MWYACGLFSALERHALARPNYRLKVFTTDRSGTMRRGKIVSAVVLLVGVIPMAVLLITNIVWTTRVRYTSSVLVIIDTCINAPL